MAFGVKDIKTENTVIDKGSGLQYTICYGRPDIKYYDRLEDLVLVNPGRKECVTYDPSKVN